MTVNLQRVRNAMQVPHADYAYRRFPKTTRVSHSTPTADLEEILKKVEELLVGLKRGLAERERMLLRLARAERCLLRKPCVSRKEYGMYGNPVAMTWNNTGMENLDRGFLPSAFRNFKEAIRQDPNLGIAHNNLGMIYLEIGDPDRAIEYLDRAIRLDENMDLAYGNRGPGLHRTWGLPGCLQQPETGLGYGSG